MSKNTSDLGSLSKQYAARDLPAHTKLKYREIGQSAPDELRKDKKDLKKDLEERERVSSSSGGASKRLSIGDSSKSEPTSSKKLKAVEPAFAPVNLDADEVLADSSSDESDDDGARRRKKNRDDNDSGEESESESENDDEDDDDEEDTEALMAELNRIKQERAAEAAKQEEERRQREEKIRMDNILKGNPLLNKQQPGGNEFKVKRRWDDDVVFKNCAKGDESSSSGKRGFVNDTLRSEFHKKFMDRYIK